MLNLSKTEQDYLKNMCLIEENNIVKGPVSVNTISQKMNVSSPSVTEMLKRLSQKKLVNYTPYHGVNLSKEGKQHAKFVIKCHRVWETFLVNNLGYTEYDVHSEAEKLEHASSPRLVESIYTLLGYPENDPHGSPIPPEIFWKKNAIEIKLSQADDKKCYTVSKIDNSLTSFLSLFNLDSIQAIEILEILPDESKVIKENKGQVLVIPKYLQDDIFLMENI